MQGIAGTGAAEEPASQAAAPTGLTEDDLVLSCDASLLYGEGGFAGDADLLARLSGRVAARTRVLGTVFPGCPARDPGTPHLHGGGADFREAQRARLAARFPPVPPTLLLESRDIRLAGNALFTLEEGRKRVLFETTRPQERHVAPGRGRLRTPATRASGRTG